MTQNTQLKPQKILRSRTKFILLGSLYTSQFLPAAFFFQALPNFLRQQGASLQVIGLLSLLTLPWILKFLWAPLVDRYGSRRWGHYKSWIVVTQCLLCLTLIACASIDSISSDAFVLFQGVFLVVTLAATQDIATDAIAVRMLLPSERGWGNGIQSAARAVGGLLGGGIMLLALDRLGWQVSVWILAGGVMLALLPLLWYHEPDSVSNNGTAVQKAAVRSPVQPLTTPTTHRFHALKASATHSISKYFETLLSFLQRPGALIWLHFI